jgi:hypothetical protein
MEDASSEGGEGAKRMQRWRRRERRSDFQIDHGVTIKRCVRSSPGPTLDNVEKAEMALSYTPARHEW